MIQLPFVSHSSASSILELPDCFVRLNRLSCYLLDDLNFSPRDKTAYCLASKLAICYCENTKMSILKMYRASMEYIVTL
jgi:hypothetical protein